MRDYRDAKAMAQTIRSALAANGLKITNSQSLELIAKAFGVADWNTLSAAINADPGAPRQTPSVAPPSAADSPSAPQRVGFSAAMEATLHRAIAYAKQRKHEHATLEHLLLALLDDQDAAAVMTACNVDMAALKEPLVNHLDRSLTSLIVDHGEDARPTAGFQRVVQRAVLHVQTSGRQSVTGAQVLVAIFSEQESRAAHLLDEQGMTRIDAVNFMVHGVAKHSGDAAA